VEPDQLVAPTDGRPKLILAPQHDQFRPYDAAVEATKDWRATTVERIDGADHFLGGVSRATADRIGEWITSDPSAS
jgi:alpha/beta superfamily hydrolase